MTRFAVQRCIGNTIVVLGIYESKEDMLAAKTALRSSTLVSPVLSMGSAESWTKTGSASPEKCTGCIDSPLFNRYNLKYGYWPIYPPLEDCLR